MLYWIFNDTGTYIKCNKWKKQESKQYNPNYINFCVCILKLERNNNELLTELWDYKRCLFSFFLILFMCFPSLYLKWVHFDNQKMFKNFTHLYDLLISQAFYTSKSVNIYKIIIIIQIHRNFKMCILIRVVISLFCTQQHF